MDEKHRLLKEYFGHTEFREGQEEIIDNVISGRDSLCIMPTGAGKSVCYQIPALTFGGVTIVVSPLISLMKDQVLSLNKSGIRAAYLNSTLSSAQFAKALSNIIAGEYKIIYVAPERLLTDTFLSVCGRIDISMVAVDEAHCVSQWGQDFRPSYLRISEFLEHLERRPVVCAFTATATKRVSDDILRLLKLRDPFRITTGFDRPNLFFSVIKPKSKDVQLLALIEERKERSGIIYCISRKAVEEVCSLLCEKGYSATRYHAGLTDSERQKNQEDFVYDRRTVMVATNAFGMGIDKSNVSYVIHYNMPRSIEAYYQEAGRAGRDGEEAECILMYGAQDVRTNKFLIENSEPNPDFDESRREEVRKLEYERLKQMTFYSTTNNCLRDFILKYFGEKQKGWCGKCSNCLTQYYTADATVQAQKILSCIARSGQKYGRQMIIEILKGGENSRIKNAGLDRLTTFGIMKDDSENFIRSVMSSLENEGYIYSSAGEYPVLKLLPPCDDLLRGRIKFELKLPKDKQPAVRKPRERNAPEGGADIELYVRLRELRRQLAAKEGVPAYVIFSNATLMDMYYKQPTTDEEFLEVSGVGTYKLRSYGRAFMAIIKDYRKKKRS